jgi:single-stranded-DNA-specific exonuclease
VEQAVVRRWQMRREGEPVPRALVDAASAYDRGSGALLAQLLWNRGIEDPARVPAFLQPTLAQGLRSPLLLTDMERATRRLADALAAGETIAVYGDYDVDGISGAAQLVGCLRELGAMPLLHVAHRQREGYGLNAGALRALADAGAKVVITADCGTANVAELTLAADLGMDVIVCDHHHAPTTRPPAWAVLNPMRADCSFPFKGLSGAGVVFYLLMGLRMELRARGRTQLPDLRRYLDLVALGTVADVVPLLDENRVLVAHGLREIDADRRPGLRALKEAALVERASVRGIGYRLGPRLNASGRLADAAVAVELLTTESDERGRTIAAELEVLNAERRAIEEQMVREAVSLAGDGLGHAVVVAGDGWHPGVVGIVAARLVDRFHKPALAIALDGDVGRGSGRSIRGVHLHAALTECGDLLDAFGGHRQAVGFTVRGERVGLLRARLSASIARATTPADLEPVLDIDACVPLAEVTPRRAEAIALLEPYGPGNPEPTLLARDVRVESVRVVGDPTRPHLKLRLRQDGWTVPAIAFGLGHLPVRPGDRLDVVFTPRLSQWQGVERLEIEIRDLRGSEVQDPLQAAGLSADSVIP